MHIRYLQRKLREWGISLRAIRYSNISDDELIEEVQGIINLGHKTGFDISLSVHAFYNFPGNIQVELRSRYGCYLAVAAFGQQPAHVLYIKHGTWAVCLTEPMFGPHHVTVTPSLRTII